LSKITAKKGAHNVANMHIPASSSLESIYGWDKLLNYIKVLTLAPELPGALEHIDILTSRYNIRASMGHSGASYEQGLAGMR
jgi:N-acetylglucosamine-6-phosphate deacetylase